MRRVRGLDVALASFMPWLRDRAGSVAPADNLGVPLFPDDDLQVHIYAFMGADPTANPGTWPVPVDLASRLLNQPIRITRGRSSGQKTLSSGSCSFTLDNTDGALTPLMATSAYYDQWDLGTPVALAVDGVGNAPMYRRFCGFVSAIEQDVIPGAGGQRISVVRVTLGGVLRRITQGSVARSAMSRSLSLTSPIGYWPLEGGTDATILTSAIDHAYDATNPIGVLPGQSDGPAGSAGAAEMPTHITSIYSIGSPIFPVGAYTSTGTVLATYHVRQSLSSSAVSWLSCISLILSGGTIARFILEWTSAGLILSAADATNATIGSAIGSSTLRLIEDGNWHEVQVLAAQSGGNVTMTLRLDGAQIATGTLVTQTLGTAAYIAGIGGDVDGSAPSIEMCHLLVHSSDVGSFTSIMNGYAGEQAHVRFARVCAEDGIPYAITATESRTVGAQPLADTAGILKDLEAVDHGVLYERKEDWGFGYMAGPERYNLSPAMTIDLATYRSTDDLGSVLVPVRNDQRIRNEWTITRTNGASVTYKDSAHQAKRGRYDDSATVNVENDGDILDEASWDVRIGTINVLRYRAMPVEPGANQSSPSDLLRPWLDTELGKTITRTGNPTPEHPYGDATFTLEGYTETVTRRGWKVDTVVEPYDAWRVLTLASDLASTDPAGVGWLDYDTCSLSAGVDATATSWSITCTPADSSDANDFPRRHFVDGELVIVTASTGGTSPTWTVTRSANGVVKSHSSGAAIALADPLVLTL